MYWLDSPTDTDSLTNTLTANVKTGDPFFID